MWLGDYIDEEQYLLLVRILLDQGCVEEAFELLARLQTAIEAGERQGRLIEALVHQSKGLSKHNKVAQALAPLGKALDLAEPEGYVRVFLDDGKPIQILLREWLASTRTGPPRDYTIYLLSQFNDNPPPMTVPREKERPVMDLVEPLSQRELEVLHLIALARLISRSPSSW